MPGDYRAQIHRGSGGSGRDPSFDPIEEGRPPTADEMRALRRLHAGGVSVVTSQDERGWRGVTVSAFGVASLAPPLVLVCLGRASEALAAIAASGSFAVSVLSDRQEFLAEQFAGRAPLVNPRFQGVKHRVCASGNPVLEECLAWFDASVVARYDGGDHEIVVGAVQEAGYGTGRDPLLYFDGGYRSLG